MPSSVLLSATCLATLLFLSRAVAIPVGGLGLPNSVTDMLEDVVRSHPGAQPSLQTGAIPNIAQAHPARPPVQPPLTRVEHFHELFSSSSGHTPTAEVPDRPLASIPSSPSLREDADVSRKWQEKAHASLEHHPDLLQEYKQLPPLPKRPDDQALVKHSRFWVKVVQRNNPEVAHDAKDLEHAEKRVRYRLHQKLRGASDRRSYRKPTLVTLPVGPKETVKSLAEQYRHNTPPLLSTAGEWVHAHLRGKAESLLGDAIARSPEPPSAQQLADARNFVYFTVRREHQLMNEARRNNRAYNPNPARQRCLYTGDACSMAQAYAHIARSGVGKVQLPEGNPPAKKLKRGEQQQSSEPGSSNS